MAATLARSLGTVLKDMWTKAFQMGYEAACKLLGRKLPYPTEAFDTLMGSYGPQWIRQIIGTLMGKLADILAGGGTLASLEAAITKLLEDIKRGYLIALTEITRASAMAAMAVYRMGGVTMVRWQTAEDARVCAVCDENEAASPLPLGQKFPGGTVAPPQHPNCRCALVPA